MRKYRKIAGGIFLLFVIFAVYVVSKEGADNKILNENIAEEFSEQQIEKYLRKELPELVEYEQYIKKKSNEQAFMIIENMGIYEEILKKESGNGFFLIYVGEKWDDHKVNWDYFLVEDSLEDIFFFDMTNNVILTLDEWRKSEYYREL